MRSDDCRLSAALREQTRRRVLLAVSRFGPRVQKVNVRLAEPPNPFGGVDQRCRMRASLLERDDIHSEAINGGFESAVARAAAQLAKRVAWALDDGASDRTHVPSGASAPVNGRAVPTTARMRQRHQPGLRTRGRMRPK